MANQTAAQGNDSDSKMFAFLGIFLTWIGFIIVMLARPNDTYAKHYAKQGLVLGIIFFVGGILFWPIAIFLGMFSAIFLGFGVILIWFLQFAIGITLFVFYIMGIIYAFSGEEKDIPLIGAIARKF